MTPDLHLVLPARAENVTVVRQAVAGLGEALGLPGHRVDDLKTVVTEASNNVVLHAYGEHSGPLEVIANSNHESVEVIIADRGGGFQPRATAGEVSLGLGLPLIASLSDGFQIRGGPHEGTRTTVRFSLDESERRTQNGDGPDLPDELEMAISPGAMVRPVLARVIGALAARAEFSVDRLADTVLLGDAVSSHTPSDLPEGRLGISIKDQSGMLEVRVGPLVEGGGERILAEMDLPGGGGSLRRLARSMDVEKRKTKGGDKAEYLIFEVAR